MLNLTQVSEEINADASPASRIKGFLRNAELSIASFQKPKDVRGNGDHLIMCKALSTVPFLTQNAAPGTDLAQYLQELADVMEFHSFPKNTPIFHYNQPGDKLYLILKGSVGIFVPRSSEQMEAERKRVLGGHSQEEHDSREQQITRSRSRTIECPQNARASPTEKLSEINLFKRDLARSSPRGSFSRKPPESSLVAVVLNSLVPNSKRNDDLELFLSFPSFKHLYLDENGVTRMYRLRNLSAGSIFGELALFASKRRTASAVAVEDVCLVSLSKENYRRIFNTSIMNMKLKVNFFQMIFQPDRISLVNRFAYVFQEKRFSFGQVLYRQGEEAKDIYLIREGEVQITKIAPDASSQTSNTSLHNDSSVDRLNRYRKVTRATKQKLNMYILSVGSMLGCKEVVEKKPHAATATVLSDTVAYVAPVDEFKDLMIRHHEFGSKVKEYIQKHKEYENDRIHDINSVKKKLDFQSQTRNNDNTPIGLEYNLRSEVLEKLGAELDSSPEPDNMQRIEKSGQSEILKPKESPGHGDPASRCKDSNLLTQDSANFSERMLQTEVTQKLSTEEPEAQEQKPHPMKPLENIFFTPRISNHRNKVLRAASTKEFRNEPQLVLQENPKKLTLFERTQTKVIIHNNRKELTASPTLSRTARDSTITQKPDQNSSHHRTNPRGSLPKSRISLDTVVSFRPYKDNAIISAVRRANLSLGARDRNKSRFISEFNMESARVIDTSHSEQKKLARTSLGWRTDRVVEANKDTWRTPRLRPDGATEIFGNATRCLTFFSIDSAREEKVSESPRIEKKSDISVHPKQIERASASVSRGQQSTRSVSNLGSPNEIANIELGAPWAKKKEALRLNLNKLTPVYFVNVKPDDPMKTFTSLAGNKTNERPETIQDIEPKLQSILLNSSKEKKVELSATERVRNTALRASMISSKHNMFRRKPKRAYIAETNYNFAKQFLSETSRR